MNKKYHSDNEEYLTQHWLFANNLENMEGNMKVEPIKILTSKNKQIPFLYNKTMDVMTKHNSHAGIVTNDAIYIDRASSAIKRELKKLGIKFDKI